MRTPTKCNRTIPTSSVEKKDRRTVQATAKADVSTSLPCLWSVRALSERWKISRQQIYRAHRNGQLRGVRILGTLRFLEQDLLELLHIGRFPLSTSNTANQPMALGAGRFVLEPHVPSVPYPHRSPTDKKTSSGNTTHGRTKKTKL